jgi:aryl-alcohol dehydrogenase-like predicted oxidoreductase
VNRRALGGTGLVVGELGLGGLFLSTNGEAFERGREATLRALDLGVDFIDTAPAYGDSETALGRILSETDGATVLSTKLGGRPEPFRPRDKRCLRQSVEHSLRALGREHIDILMVHEPDRPGQYDWWTDPDAVRGPVLELLDELRTEGTIRFTGIGGTTAYELARLCRTGRFDVVLTAFNYSLLWREAELEVLPAAREAGMAIVVGAPLQQGALARRLDDGELDAARWLTPPRRAQYRDLYALLDEAGLEVAATAVRFVLSNPAVSCVLTGVRTSHEVEANVAAASRGPLSPDVLAGLEAIAARVPFRPFDEPACLPVGVPYAGPGPMC